MNTQKFLKYGLLGFVFSFMLCGTIHAATYDIKEMTPEIKAALDARKSRFDQLVQLKAQGKVGETNQGYVQALIEDTETQALVKAENENRALIYNTIVAQNGLADDQCSIVEKVFAQVQRDKAAPGDSIQDESGQWIKK